MGVGGKCAGNSGIEMQVPVRSRDSEGQSSRYGSRPKVPYGPSYNGLPSNLMLRLGGFLGRE